MKGLKFIGLLISKLGLSIGVMCLLLSYSLNGFINGGVTSVLVNNPMTVEIFETSGIDTEKVQEFVESEEIQVLIDKYVNPLLEGNVDISSVNIGYDLLEFIRENREKIESVTGAELPMEDIEVYLQGEEIEQINEAYKEAAVQIQDSVPTEVKETVSGVRYFFSEEFRNIMLIVSVVGLILTALLQWSPYIWIRTLGNTLTWCGALVVVFGSLVSILLSGMFAEAGMSVNFTKCLYSSLIVFGIGVVLLIVYGIIKKLVGKRAKVNEVSQMAN